MENSHSQKGSHFTAGFLLGVLVGALAVFLFATKKGRKILLLLTDEGFPTVTKLSDIVKIIEGDKKREQKDIPAQEEHPKHQQQLSEMSPAQEQQSQPQGVQHFLSNEPRFFKNIPRKQTN